MKNIYSYLNQCSELIARFKPIPEATLIVPPLHHMRLDGRSTDRTYDFVYAQDHRYIRNVLEFSVLNLY